MSADEYDKPFKGVQKKVICSSVLDTHACLGRNFKRFCHIHIHTSQTDNKIMILANTLNVNSISETNRLVLCLQGLYM